MNKLTDIELEFLRKEASKLDGLDFLKRFINNFWGKIPMPGTLEDLKDFTIKDKNKYINDHKKWTQTFKKAIKLVGKVEIEILEEGTYETGKKEIKKEYGVIVSIFSKENKEEDQLFINKTFQGGVNYQLTFYIENLLREKLKDYREQSKKKLLFKKSGHLVDQILKTTQKKINTLDLFSNLSEEIKTELQQEGVEISRELFSGINLTAPEMKLQDVFSILLFQQSQTNDPKKEGYYTGIKPLQTGSYLGGKGAIAPGIELSYFSIAKEYTGKKNPSGEELKNVKKILDELGKKKFLIKHTETYTNKKTKEKAIIERSGYKTLFEVDEATLTIEDKDGNQTVKGKTFIIVLNPIYREQIATKWTLQPLDILQQLTIANGSPNIPLATMRLKEYLFSIIVNSFEHKIGARKLYEKLEPKLMEVPRIAKVRENTTRAIETLIKLGLIIRYEIGKSQVGEDMYIFYLNENYL